MEPTSDAPRPAEPPGRDAIVSLREITRATVRDVVRLAVAPAQTRFVLRLDL